MIERERLWLVPFTAEHAGALADGASHLGSLLRTRIPDGWPHFSDAYGSDPTAPVEPRWGTHLFMLKDGAALVGSGGFKGGPREGAVEVGYEIAPEFQGQGFATEATRAMIEHAFSLEEVLLVQAHTLAEPNASTRVLEKVGMLTVETIKDSEEGPIWRWVLQRDDWRR